MTQTLSYEVDAVKFQHTILLILGSELIRGYVSIDSTELIGNLGGPDCAAICAYWTSCWPVYTGTCWGWMFSDIVTSIRKKLVGR